MVFWVTVCIYKRAYPVSKYIRMARMSVQMCVRVLETIPDANMKKKEVEDPKNIVKLS